MKKALLIAAIFITVQVNAQSNYSLGFDGVNDYVSAPHNAALNFTNFTLEAWINLSSNTGGLTIVAKGDGTTNGGTNYIFNVGGNGANAKLGLFAGGAWYSANTALSRNVWYHAAVTVSGSAVSFYLNGVPDGVAMLSSAMYTGGTYSFRIGEQGDACNCNYMNGKIDEVRVWNVARTEAEIKANLFNKNLSNSAAGLVGYYRFNEGSGTNTANSSTNTAGIDGTLTNGPTWPASPIQFGTNAVNFDGSSNYVELTNRINFGTSNFTIEAWINPASTSFGVVLGQEVCGDAEQQFRFYTQNSTGGFYLSDAQALGAPYSVQLTSSPNSVPLNTWTHVAVVRSGNNYSLYINGALNATASSGANTINNQSGADVNKRLRIGARGGISDGCGLNYFAGNLDEIRYWNVARTATEIQQNYQYEIDPAANTNLAAYYTFNQGIASGNNSELTTLMDMKGANNGTFTNFGLVGASGNFITQNATLVVLPLQWLGFTAQKQAGSVLLKWSTEAEVNTKDFLVQHSTNAAQWSTIGSLASAGTFNTVNNYSLVHSNPATGMNFYRILQRDRDGRELYSEIRSVKFTGFAKSSFTVLSNPVVDGSLCINVHQPVTLILYSSEGRLIWQGKAGSGITTIDLGQYAKGTYILTAGDQREKILLY